MANFFYSVGYSVEKVRSGIVTCPYDLWTEDERKPLGPSLGYLRNISPGGYDTTVKVGRSTASI